MKTNLIIDISQPVWQNSGSQVLKTAQNFSKLQSIKLQDSLKCNISKKK